jgi:hypothetical protein
MTSSLFAAGLVRCLHFWSHSGATLFSKSSKKEALNSSKEARRPEPKGRKAALVELHAGILAMKECMGFKWHRTLTLPYALAAKLNPLEYHSVATAFVMWLAQTKPRHMVVNMMQQVVGGQPLLSLEKAVENQANALDSFVESAHFDFDSAPDWLHVCVDWQEEMAQHNMGVVHQDLALTEGVVHAGKVFKALIGKRAANKMSVYGRARSEGFLECEEDLPARVWKGGDTPTHWETVHWFASWLWTNERDNTITALACILFQAGYAFCWVVVIAVLFDAAAGEHPHLAELGAYVAFLLVGAAAKARSKYVLETALPSGGGFVGVMQAQILIHMSRVHKRHLRSLNTAAVFTLLETDILLLNDTIDGIFNGLAAATVLAVSVLLVVGTVPYLGMGLCLALVPVWYVHDMHIINIEDAGNELQDARVHMNAKSEEVLNGDVTVRSLGLHTYIADVLTSLAESVNTCFRSYHQYVARGRETLAYATLAIQVPVFETLKCY